MLIFQFLPLLWLATTVLSAQVTGVFTAINNIVPPANQQPHIPSWQATVAWTIDSSKVAPGDTFTLTLPDVFKFTSTTNTLVLSSGGTNYATCTLTSGENLLPYSLISCTALPAVTTVAEADGTITFPFTFNAGMTNSPQDLAAATLWTPGQNLVTFQDGADLTFTVTMSAGAYYIQSDPNQGSYMTRKLTRLQQMEHYYQGPTCIQPMSGTITMALGGQTPFDCSQSGAYLSDSFNAWQFPSQALTTAGGGSITYTCSPSAIVATFTNIPAGYRPYIVGFSNVITGQYVDVYSGSGICGYQAFSQTVTYQSYNDLDPNGTGNVKPIVVTTITRDDINTPSLTTAIGVSTNTIEVLVPRSVTTVTTTWTNPYSSETTTTDSSGIRIVEIQVPYSTSTTIGPLSGTETVTESGTTYVRVTDVLSTSTTLGPLSGTETVTESGTTYVRVTDVLSTSTTLGPLSGTETVTER